MRNVILFLKKEDGVTAIEYALIDVLIFLVIVGAVSALGTDLSGLYQRVVDAFL